ncbi:ABC transporter permease [Agromyces protaetiae]|uniref:Transport permease protein n=1 Tax=Agromyces protaetiae TaxID=2509455 RepID=A0A4P6FCH0_9MICO|nr:ABC transporter permease [Agromyces protaetiae]QAY72643.1 ABC transporter permease [Agromyces protaetiae]
MTTTEHATHATHATHTTHATRPARWPLADGWTIVHRNLLALKRNPAIVAANLVGPIAMVLLFGYVFGGALAAGGDAAAYREALVPAAFVLVAGTGLIMAAGSAALDVQNGVTERFRSLPMQRIAVPFGQAGSQLVLSALSLAVMSGLGVLVGWRIHTDVWSAAAAFLLLLFFGYALSWVGIYMGLLIRNVEVVQQLSAPIFGLVMLSNAFVPTATMPPVIRDIAEWSPFSAAITAVRDLFGNGTIPDGPLPLAHPVLTTLIWSIALIAIFGTLAARRYAKRD